MDAITQKERFLLCTFIPEIHGVSLGEFCYFFPKVLQIRKVCLSLQTETIKREIMTARREKSKPQKPQMNK